MKSIPSRLQDLYNKRMRSTKEFVKLIGFHRTTIQRNFKKNATRNEISTQKISDRPKILNKFLQSLTKNISKFVKAILKKTTC